MINYTDFIQNEIWPGNVISGVGTTPRSSEWHEHFLGYSHESFELTQFQSLLVHLLHM